MNHISKGHSSGHNRFASRGQNPSSRGHFRGKSNFRGGSRGNNRAGRGGFSRSRIDVSRYINKGVPVVASAPFVPENKFADFMIDQRLKDNIITKGYVNPTPIQDKSINHILQGKDIVGSANTGTGKTAAFLIPLIDKVLKGKDEQVLIVVPTRELALQIDAEFKMFARNLKLFSVCAVGGSALGRQISQLRYHNSFVIGTPGRIRDLMERKCLNLSKFKTIVLDEADRMLDMGFVNDMRFMISHMPAVRHTLFFSATLSSEVERLIKDFLKDPVRVSVKTQDTSKNIEQDIIRVPAGKGKIDTLHELLISDGFGKVLIFGKTKHGVERLSEILTQRGHKSSSIHGNKSQPQRQRALADFKENRARILVATDVAARGLDIPNVTHVINYDLPATHEDYIHRIGRTGRGDHKGKALTFVE